MISLERLESHLAESAKCGMQRKGLSKNVGRQSLAHEGRALRTRGTGQTHKQALARCSRARLAGAARACRRVSNARARGRGRAGAHALAAHWWFGLGGAWEGAHAF